MELHSNFLNTLIDQTKDAPPTMLLPESTEPKILSAASCIADVGAVKPVLLGDGEKIRRTAAENGIDIGGCKILQLTDDLKEETIQAFRKVSQDFSEKSLRRRMKDPQYLAAALVRIGRYDCLASGYACTTGETVMACRAMLGMKPGIENVSSLCVLEAPDFHGEAGNLLCFTDCVVFADPDSEGLADIAISSSDTMHALLGWKTKTALLSYSTAGSGEGASVDKVTQAVRIANERRPDLLIDGEFQLDAAIDPVVAEKKVKRPSEVAGRANIIVFPDLAAGNIGVKLVNYFAGLPVHGALLQGLSVPTVDFSRSASTEQIIGALLMLAAAVKGSRES